MLSVPAVNIRNYSIYLKDDLLFGYYEYHGTDYQADIAKIASDPKTQEWSTIMEPMQWPLDTEVDVVVDYIRNLRRVDKVALVSWSQGTQQVRYEVTSLRLAS